MINPRRDRKGAHPFHIVPLTGFEPAISTLRGWRPYQTRPQRRGQGGIRTLFSEKTVLQTAAPLQLCRLPKGVRHETMSIRHVLCELSQGEPVLVFPPSFRVVSVPSHFVPVEFSSFVACPWVTFWASRGPLGIHLRGGGDSVSTPLTYLF